jgi:hypothetical protein
VVNAETNDDRTEQERDANGSVNERMRALGRRSGEARRRRKAEQEQAAGELTDRERALAALRRALDGNNMAAMTAAAKALLDLPAGNSDPRELWRLRYAVWDMQAEAACWQVEAAALRMELNRRQGVGDGELDEVIERAADAFVVAVVAAAEGRVASVSFRERRASEARPAPELMEEIEAEREERREQETVPVSPSAVSASSVPFEDPAFKAALEERRSLGLGPVVWDDEDV